MTKLYPRLERADAGIRFREVQNLLERKEPPNVKLDGIQDAVFAATGAPRVDRAHLEELRAVTVALAEECGFPDPGRRRDGQAQFDAECAVLLHERMEIFPGEAAKESVWSFLTLNVLPDVAAWRFPDLHESRLLGGRARNTFQRLWWRAHLINPGTKDRTLYLLRSLPEDALVQITERPGVCADRRLATIIAQVGVKIATTIPKGSRESMFRSALKRIRQVLPVLCLEAMNDEEVRTVIEKKLQDAASAG